MAQQDEATQAEGLLEQIADTALDDDYYVVRTGPGSSRGFNTGLTAAVLAAFALLVTVAALQTRNDRPATERERQSLVSDVASRKKLLASRQDTEDRLSRQVASLSAKVDRYDPDYEDLRLTTADRGAAGPGITVRVSPGGGDAGRISDSDLQRLVNSLWYAGAEAVAINGQRLGSLSSIRTAGDVVTVNFVSIGAPYTVIALGDGESLEQRFVDTPAGQALAARRDNAGVTFDVTTSADLTVPAAPPNRLTLKHATVVKGDA